MTAPEPLDRVEVLAPLGAEPLAAFLARPLAPVEPFAEARLEAVAALADGLLKAPSVRKDPASVAAAFWLRKANLVRLRQASLDRRAADGLIRVPVGRVFHVAPANVDTLFLYSWAIAFLCGNTNVVRLSRQRPPLVEALLAVLAATAEAHPCLREQNRFVTYEHDDQISARFSAWCGHRIVWGGDATVAAFRQVPLNPHASERCFASKYSYAMVKASAYLALDEAARDRLATAFYNDFFVYDQAACSSPQVLCWVGAPDQAEAASAAFLDRLQREADRKGHRPDVSQVSNRLNAAFDLALRTDVVVDLGRSALVTLRADRPEAVTKQVCGGGLLRVLQVPEAEALLPLLEEGDQTVSVHGFDRAELERLAPAFGARGVDRIVPIGEALAFEPVWDGFDLVEDCLRRVTVR